VCGVVEFRVVVEFREAVGVRLQSAWSVHWWKWHQAPSVRSV
jgi:hypothetical protein